MSSATQVFDVMSKAVDDVGATLVPKVKGVIKFDITGTGIWLVDLKNGKGSVTKSTGDAKADLSLTISESNFLLLIDNKLNPQQAFMKGLVKIKGNMGLAMKLNVVLEATRTYMKKQSGSIATPAPGPATPAAAAPSGLKSAELFQALGEVVKKDGANLRKKVNGIIQFSITPGGAWNLDLKSETPSLTEGTKKADVTLTVSDADFLAIATGKLNAQQAFMKGKLKLKGNMALAMKLSAVFDAIKPTSKL